MPDSMLEPTQFSGATIVLGVIGDPIAQARAPAMANQLLGQRGLLGRYVLVPMHVAAPDLAACIAGLRTQRNFGGAIITMPHKTSVAPLLDTLTPAAQLAGAVNVIARDAAGALGGTVLDGEGFVGGLAAAGHAVAGKRCVLAGAGGAASAIAFSLAAHGCGALHLRNRTAARAEALARRLRAAFPNLPVDTAVPRAGAIDIAINATRLGMQPGEALPLEAALLERTALVAECVIAPEITPLLELARRLGKQTHTGVPMLTAQIGLMLDFMGVA